MARTPHVITTSSTKPDDRGRYVVEFSNHLSSILSRRHGYHVVSEAVSRETLRVMERVDDYMRRYPDPRVLARVACTGSRAVIGLLRVDNAQRGAGSKGARRVFSLSDDTAPGIDLDAKWGYIERCDRYDDLQMLQALLAPLTKRQRELLLLVDGYGYTVTEAAARLGIARETAARDRSRAYRSIGVQPPV
ncbi:MAG: hypothetical protein RI900_1172 [Actinomycetota bacterium]|jgi:DNA-binding CsgD family transcriptional regulator